MRFRRATLAADLSASSDSGTSFSKRAATAGSQGFIAGSIDSTVPMNAISLPPSEEQTDPSIHLQAIAASGSSAIAATNHQARMAASYHHWNHRRCVKENSY